MTAPPLHHQPVRGSDVEAWIKHWREQFRSASMETTDIWWAVNDMLADYRERADTGKPLNFYPHPE